MDVSLWINGFILLVFLVFVVFKIKKDFKLFFLLVPVYYQAATTLLSIAYIESGNYISEQARDGFFVGAGIYYIFFFFLTIEIIELGIKYFNKHLSFKLFSFSLKGKNVELLAIEYIMIVVLFLLFLNVILSPSPLTSDTVNHFTYWKYSKLSFLQTIFGNTSVFIPFISGLIFLQNKRKGIFYLILYFIYIVLIGQKFSPFVNGFYAFFLPYILLDAKFSKIRICDLFNYRIIIVVVLLFSLVAYKYSLNNPFKNIGAETVFEAIIYRAFGLQAHLFWGSVEQFAVGKPELLSWRLSDLNEGMHILMRYFWPGNLKDINAAIENNFSFTNAYPAILFKIYPLYLVYIVHAFLVLFLFLPITWLFIQLLAKQKLVFAVIGFQFYFWTIYAFSMGYFYKIKYPLALILFVSLISFIIQKAKSEHAKTSV